MAFAATLFCAWLAAEGAIWLPRKTPRLFTAAALFALNWAILLLYYLPGPPQDEILSAFSGFVLVYVGLHLMREARDSGNPADRHSVGWEDALPVHLLRTTAGGFGLYLLLRQIFRIQYGYGTLALALWGTVLTVLGYLFIWLGVTRLYGDSRARRRVALGLGALLALYSACEWSYFGWYAANSWPPYHRYLKLQAQPSSPDFDRSLPFQPQPNWPEYHQWQRIQTRPDWPELRRVLALKVEPRLPRMWIWLEDSFSALKILFTFAFLGLLWRRPEPRSAST